MGYAIDLTTTIQIQLFPPLKLFLLQNMPIADQINLAIAIVSGLTALASLAVMFATFKILQANRESVEVMREQVRSLSRPYIQVTPWVRTGSTLMMLTIRNAGSTNAKNLKLSMDRDFYFNGEKGAGKNLREFSAFAEIIECLPPHAELVFHLGVGHVIFGKAEHSPSRFTITADYDFEGEHASEATVVDLHPFQFTAQPIDPVAEQIEKLSQALREIARDTKSGRTVKGKSGTDPISSEIGAPKA